MLTAMFGFLVKLNATNISLVKVLAIGNSNTIAVGNRLNENSIGEIYILKLSNDGNVILSKSIYTQNYLIANDAVYKNGKIYIVGTINMTNEANNLIFLAADTNGNVIISRYISIDGYETPNAITMINNKIYVIGTRSQSGFIRPFLLIFDTLGNPLILRLAFLMPQTANLKGLFVENNNIYVFGDYYENKRISFIFNFDTFFNFIEGKRIYDTTSSQIVNLPIFGFSKKADSLFALFSNFLLKLDNNWVILGAKDLSGILPRFLNYLDTLEIFGIYNSKPSYYKFSSTPSITYPNIFSNNLKYANENYLLFNSTTDYILSKSSSNCDTIKSQTLYLNDITVDKILIEDYQTVFQDYSVPYADISLNVKDVSIALSDACESSNYGEFEISVNRIYDVYRVDGTYVGRFRVGELNNGLYILRDGKRFKKFLKFHSP